MASGSKTQDRKPNIELPGELTYDFLKKITNDFSEGQKISESQFGTLYKGILPDDGRVIAVKKLQENAQLPADISFTRVAQNLIALKHENIVQVVGFCNERQPQADITESLICYEYLPKGSLRENLFGSEQNIDWDTRFKIVKGICSGLHFLHKLDKPIIHMDLKPENIWLDANMVPKIADFALSRVLDQQQPSLSTQTVVGSYGYMAPEYLYKGEISAKSDIYSLGVMILEITTGEQNSQEANQPSARKYIERIQDHWKPELIAFKYSSLDSEGLERVKVCISIGLECVNIDQEFRPPIDNIVSRLDGYS